jgi:GAF domain-containing protein
MPLDRWSTQAGARSRLLIALRKDNALLGSLWFYHKDATPFGDTQIALLQNFAAQAVMASNCWRRSSGASPICRS